MTRARTRASETKKMKGSVPQQRTVRSPRVGDWVIATAMLAVFAACYVLAGEWPFRAALFPQIVTVTGAVLSVVKLLGLGVATVRARRTAHDAPAVPPARAADPPSAAPAEPTAEGPGAPHSGLRLVDDDEEDDHSMEYVFASAGGRAWAASLAWTTVFFVSFFVLGAYITVPVFALAYLRFSGKASWRAAAAYAAVTGVIIYFVFRELVFIPLPESPFPFLPF